MADPTILAESTGAAGLPEHDRERAAREIRRRLRASGPPGSKVVGVDVRGATDEAAQLVSVSVTFEELDARGLVSIRNAGWHERLDELLGDSLARDEREIRLRETAAMADAVRDQQKPGAEIQPGTRGRLQGLYDARVKHTQDRLSHLRADSNLADFAAVSSSIALLRDYPEPDDEAEGKLLEGLRAKASERLERDIRRFKEDPRYQVLPREALASGLLATQLFTDEGFAAAEAVYEAYPAQRERVAAPSEYKTPDKPHGWRPQPRLGPDDRRQALRAIPEEQRARTDRGTDLGPGSEPQRRARPTSAWGRPIR